MKFENTSYFKLLLISFRSITINPKMLTIQVFGKGVSHFEINDVTIYIAIKSDK